MNPVIAQIAQDAKLRRVAIAGDQLTLTVRPTAGDVVDVIWKRAN
jgi:hypothetical protein